MLCNLPSVGHKAGEAAAGSILYDQSHVCLCEDCLKGIDDVDVPLPKVGLDLQQNVIIEKGSPATYVRAGSRVKS